MHAECNDDEADEAVRSQQNDYRDVRRCNEEQDYHSRDAVTRALKADVARVFAQARRPKTIVGISSATATSATNAREPLCFSHCGDGQPDEAQQTRHDDDFEVQHSDEQPDQKSRADVARTLRADVSALFARARQTKPLVASASATASSATAARESLRVSLDSIPELTADMRIALKRGDAHMSVSDAVAQPEKQPVQATQGSQPRRAGLMMQRWPSKTKES